LTFFSELIEGIPDPDPNVLYKVVAVFVGNYQSANMPIEAFLIFFDQGGKGGFSGGGHSKA
jgi:hypothetical protein